MNEYYEREVLQQRDGRLIKLFHGSDSLHFSIPSDVKMISLQTLVTPVVLLFFGYWLWRPVTIFFWRVAFHDGIPLIFRIFLAIVCIILLLIFMGICIAVVASMYCRTKLILFPDQLLLEKRFLFFRRQKHFDLANVEYAHATSVPLQGVEGTKEVVEIPISDCEPIHLPKMIDEDEDRFVKVTNRFLDNHRKVEKEKK